MALGGMEQDGRARARGYRHAKHCGWVPRWPMDWLWIGSRLGRLALNLAAGTKALRDITGRQAMDRCGMGKIEGGGRVSEW